MYHGIRYYLGIMVPMKIKGYPGRGGVSMEGAVSSPQTLNPSHERKLCPRLAGPAQLAKPTLHSASPEHVGPGLR